jgi:hypothetical protein
MINAPGTLKARTASQDLEGDPRQLDPPADWLAPPWGLGQVKTQAVAIGVEVARHQIRESRLCCGVPMKPPSVNG